MNNRQSEFRNSFREPALIREQAPVVPPPKKKVVVPGIHSIKIGSHEMVSDRWMEGVLKESNALGFMGKRLTGVTLRKAPEIGGVVIHLNYETEI